jgi:hypothetical protein
VFHALGFTESFSTIDTGAGVVPGGSGSVGARGQGVTPQVAAHAALQVVTFALPWVVLLAAAARSFARARAPRRLSVLASDIGVGLAARGAALVALLWVLWRSSWWVQAAYPVFAFGAAELLLLLLAYGVVSRSAEGESRRGPQLRARTDRDPVLVPGS